ncbi:NADPH-dependent F420 reductase [Streptomyces sp. NBC_00338]|uniref:NADPH-dependent F420 reductase n=1 Tax=Streptomyces sp. NBC_00338 TaxID=2975715 RepID=UPI00224FC71C|nr:NAD(P)-binding domain-containing protein [Streptomyces sp. NBC_00338]MCX5139229.1 NAD(P)-binding domain-containing protein [Streptomyces sp. NBC_00338]
MRIGVLGTGNMAQALGTQWAGAGHQLLFAGRSAVRARALADRTGSASGTFEEAVSFGSVLLLALPYDAALDTVTALAAADGTLRDRVLIDCTNAVGPGFVLTTEGGPGAARTLADATGARVVKAFNHLPDTVWRLTPPAFADGPLSVPLCGDDAAALETVAVLVRDLGCVPLPVGGLDRAAYLEATTAFLIGLWHSGHDPRTLLPPFAAATA